MKSLPGAWRAATIAAGIGLALQLWIMLEIFASAGPSEAVSLDWVLDKLLINSSMVACVAIATLAADRSIDRGTRASIGYGAAVVGGTAVASLVQLALHRALRMPTESDLGGLEPLALAQPLRVFLEYLLWSTLIVSVYASLREQRLAAARLKAIQLGQAQIRRRTVESSLQVLRARVDPQMLIDTLAQVRDRYAADPAGSGRVLDDLVERLRAAQQQPNDAQPAGDAR
jgi:hypothetical protein